ncbi:MAG: CHC2 zinc finger domain-containing protein, partial [Candidatus Omnitrophota bacterium]
MDQAEEVKSKIDIVSLINDYLPLKKSGRNYQALCPFHDEKTPSFMVSPELQIYKCFGCFPPGSLIKTSKGLRPIEAIKRGDAVYSHRGRIRKVLLTFERPYSGSLTSIKLRKLGGRVTLTDDHKVFVLRGAPYLHKKFKNLSRRIRHDKKNYDRETFLNKFEKYFSIKKIKAGDLAKNDYLLYPVVEKVRDVSLLPLKHYINKKHPPHGTKPRKIDYNIPVNDTFLKLLGYYIAEGSSNRAYIRFSLGLHENEFSEDIKGIISDLFKLKVGVHKRKRKSGSGLEITCCHSLLADAFSNMCGTGASNKHIPYILNFLPCKKQKILLKAIQRGDGHQFRSSRGGKLFNAINTTSPTLKDQIKDILLRLGYFPTVTIKKPRVDENGVNHQKAYVVKWSDEAESRYKLSIRTRDNSLFWVLPIYDLKKETYEGKVFNLNVEKDHSYVSENFAVGNCGAGGDAISFLEEYEKIEFWEALEILAKRAGVKLEKKGFGKGEEKKKRLYEINHLAAEFYHFI